MGWTTGLWLPGVTGAPGQPQSSASAGNSTPANWRPGAEVAIDEGVARLRPLRRPVRQAEMPLRVLVPTVRLEKAVLLHCARLDLIPLAAPWPEKPFLLASPVLAHLGPT